jgi:cytochrome b6-f complex iron-sulfur subunit
MTTTPSDPERRSFFSKFALILMGAGLFAGYGTFASFAARFLFPSKDRSKGWMYVSEVKRLNVGDALSYESPEGTKIAVARQGSSGAISDFIALSSTCPHLGCQVNWEGQNDRFFCPCHNGVFDPSGKAISGPPADAKQSLDQYPLKIDRGLLFIEVPLERMSAHRQTLRPAGGFPGAGLPTGISGSH